MTRVIVDEQEFADLLIAEIKSWSEEDKAEARECLYRWADAIAVKQRETDESGFAEPEAI